MESLNKFKILTIIFLCMFVFIVAAIYTNTKDVSTGKMKLKNEAENAQVQEDINAENQNNIQNTNELTNMAMQIDNLNKRVDELTLKLNNTDPNAVSSGSSTGLNCRIIGALTPEGIEQLTAEAAVQEAKVNNRELAIACSFQ